MSLWRNLQCLLSCDLFYEALHGGFHSPHSLQNLTLCSPLPKFSLLLLRKSLKYFPLLPAPWSFWPHAPCSLNFFTPFSPLPKTPMQSLFYPASILGHWSPNVSTIFSWADCTNQSITVLSCNPPLFKKEKKIVANLFFFQDYSGSAYLGQIKISVKILLKQSFSSVKLHGACQVGHHPIAEKSMQCNLRMNLVQSILCLHCY